MSIGWFLNDVKNRKLYNMIHHEIVGKAAVNKLGFVYEPDIDKCREHMFNDIRICSQAGWGRFIGAILFFKQDIILSDLEAVDVRF